MSLESLRAGHPVAALIVDGAPETPFVAATLAVSASGIDLDIPFLDARSVSGFEHVDGWRRTGVPQSLQLLVPGAKVSLFDLRYAGENLPSEGASILMVRATEAVLAGRDGPVSDPLEVETVRSRLDGLNGWSQVTAVTTDRAVDAESRVYRLTVVAETGDGVVWRQGDAEMALQAHWRTDNPGVGDERALLIADDVTLETTFASPRPFRDHLVEQRKIANLMVFIYGRSMSFRQHKVRDERFPARLLSGEIYDIPYVELVSARTLGEAASEPPTREDLARPLALLPAIGVGGLTRWAEVYDEWKRFILPAVNSLARRGALIEEVVMSTSTAIEAAGRKIGKCDGEEGTYSSRGKETTATYSYRCLKVLDLPWGDYVMSLRGLAQAMADNYNELKHEDRGDFPDPRQSYLIGLVNKWVVRLLALRLTGSDHLIEPHRSSGALWHITQAFEANHLRTLESGEWEAF
ncbi:hypothetical protein FE251_01905 [Georgenia wutianyii]|uniref:ApeA N-terminal domain-containing protein n=1 Tax=Georgenia wutianyii TaxID=2585135 RepID=A0ABX5VKQ8_9MICO|nr:hypothetical protein [Georgenia wutianyii]QDB78266.1 hypothetical protein FE251_01905 [Georgenia wutianyii]